MARHLTCSNGPAWIKILIHDLLSVSLIGVVALCGGLILNQFRENRLPLIYSPKAERMQRAVAKFDGLSAAVSESKLPRGDVKAASTPTEVRYLDLAEMRRIVDGKTNVILLDARPEVFNCMGHIPGAISLSRENFEKDYAKRRAWLESNKSQCIVIYCADSECEDSQMVADALVKLAYTCVFVFKGGWNDWTSAHLPEEKAQ